MYRQPPRVLSDWCASVVGTQPSSADCAANATLRPAARTHLRASA